jgi:hypothetical protein
MCRNLIAMLRSIVAVLAGFFVTVTLSLGADALLRAAWPSAFDPGGAATSAAVLVTELVYTIAFAMLGAYIAARAAVRHRLRHALILGSIAVVLSVAVAVTAWSTAPSWYHICAVGFVLPSAWAGGRIGDHATPARVT